ncbi:hypothetical protein E2P81_ATG02403 [Venturia nashicola]|nr:hypothetical protein E2P81_ATG02403 [Venturia nashicola]
MVQKNRLNQGRGRKVKSTSRQASVGNETGGHGEDQQHPRARPAEGRETPHSLTGEGWRGEAGWLRGRKCSDCHSAAAAAAAVAVAVAVAAAEVTSMEEVDPV